MFDAAGKVRPNMGMQRLRELDRKKWLQRKEQEKRDYQVLREMNSC
jgi:hypothetical protein